MFGSADTDNGDTFHRWVSKLHRHAQLRQWTDRETLLQFELHLTGRAELLYEVLPSDAKLSIDAAVTALRDRLQLIQHAALALAQLMRRKLGTQETVDKYTQCFRSYHLLQHFMMYCSKPVLWRSKSTRCLNYIGCLNQTYRIPHNYHLREHIVRMTMNLLTQTHLDHGHGFKELITHVVS